MADYLETLSDRIWAILEADVDVVAHFTAGRRDKPPTEVGFLRGLIARAPADFPRIELRIINGSHSAFTGTPPGVPPVLAMDGTTITAIAGPDFEIYRSVRVQITIWHPLTNNPGANPYLEDTITALMQSGPRLGDNALILNWGRIDFSTRPIRKGEMGGKQAGAGEITTIAFPINTRQLGKLTIA